MEKTTHTLTGQIIDRNTQKGLYNLRIEAWDKNTIMDHPLATSATDKEGTFSLQIDTSDLNDKKPELVFKIYQGDQLIQTTPFNGQSNGKENGRTVIVVDFPAPDHPTPQPPDNPDESWRVMGKVTTPNGEPVSVQVRAFNVRLNGQQPLGQGPTEKGNYVITFQPEVNDSPSACKRPDLLVQAYRNDEMIASSPIIYNADKVTNIDLVVGNETYKGPSEYQQLEQTLRPCLGDQDPATLTGENIEYLAHKTGANQEWIQLYVLAHRQGNITEAAPPLFYGCYRKRLPYSLDKLIALRSQVIRSRIKMAIDENIIHEKWEKEVDDFIAALKNSSIKSALTIDDTSSHNSLGKVFTQINVPAASQAPLLNLYVKHQEDTPAFWKALREDPALGQYEKQLRLGLKVSALTQHFEPATKVLMEHPVLAQGAEISRLATLSSADWTQLAKNIGTAPENIPGEGDEQIENYARLMEKSVMSAFPTQYVAANISKSDPYQNTELPKFFEVATDFSFEGTHIPAYVDKLNGNINDKETVIRDLSKLQRLYYLAPAFDRYQVMEMLDKEGFSSAFKVRQYGKKAFINIFGRKLGSKALAAKVFHKASHIGATTMNLALQYNDLSGGVLPYVLQGKKGKNIKPEELDLPDLRTLFGGQSFCSCTHCRSVYSAAAYFVDLLSYLKEHYVINTQASTDEDIVYVEKSPGVYLNGLDLLFVRRSDLGDIVLNCENTNTVIPYLDIVNEVLENAVLHITEAYQTTSTSEELKANPEHIKKGAYDNHLAKEIFPFTQPFNLWNEEGNVYLEHLSVPRYRMMDTFQFHGNENEPDDQAKYTVQLNLTKNAEKIVIGETTIDSTTYAVKDFWGVPETQWRVVLRKVRTFIDKAEITYEQLLEFLQLKFVNATGIVKVKFAPEAPCDIEQAVLAYWDESTQAFTTDPIHEKFFIRAHCFFRLLQKTPWTIFELGRVMDSLGVQNINENFIEKVAILLQLQSKLKIEPLALASWWALLNTQSDQNDPDGRSFYARHFLNKTVFDPKEINEETFVFTLNADGTELNNTGNLISEYLNEIAAALNISAPDLLLLTETLTTTDGVIDDALTLNNLSQLFRMASFTKALDISVKEYLIATDFISANPFDNTHPTELLAFVEQIEQVKSSSFTFIELQYLLLNTYNSAEGIAPTEDKIITLFMELQDGLTKIKAEHEVPLDDNDSPVDPIGDICQQKLSFLLEEEGIAAVVAIVEAVDGLSPEQEADAATYLSFLDADQLIIDFSTEAYSTLDTRYAYILQRLVDHLIVTQSRSFVIQTLSSDLSIDLDTSELLLAELVYSTGSEHDPNDPVYAIDDFTDPVFAYDELEEEEEFDLGEFSVQHNTYVVLCKSALFIHKFRMNAKEVHWTFTQSPDIGWLDLNAISGAAADVFIAWRKMEYFFRMRVQYAEGDITFFDLMDYAANPVLIDTLETGYEEEIEAFIAASTTWTEADKSFLILLRLLSEITGWETDSLYYLASTEAYALTFTDFKDEQAFYQLMQCFEVLHTLGASARDVWTWMKVDLTAENSSNIKQTAKARYSETQWLKVAAPLRDVLREKQRDALTTYLIQNRNFEDENELYEHYLLDVETSACTMSSRIVLANSSVQLFIQRHLMNLEKKTLDLDADRWEWMKNYRVWEANRKVFLYPENWIEPELRLVKSEFFTDLQNALLQNDVTADLVEGSVKDYLEKLDAVSNIEVCGMYHQYEEGEGSTAEDRSKNTIDVLHVFGRTSSIPEEYYYRTYINDSYWTPWEKVNLAIQGKHLIPVVINRRLYLFWAEFTEKQEEISDTNVMTYWDIRLSYSEFKNGNWLPKMSFDDYVESNQLGVALALEAGTLNLSNYGLHNFCFLTKQYSSYLKIECLQLLDTGLSTNYQYENGEFKFYYGTKKIVADKPISHIQNLIKPTGTDMDYMTFKEEGSADLELVNAEVDENGNYVGNDEHIKVLDTTPGTFRIPLPHQYDEFVSQVNFFYGDDERNFFVKPYHSFGAIKSSTDSPSQESTLNLDFYMQESDIAVGIFQETTYDTHEMEEILFDTAPKDQIDPMPTPIIRNRQGEVVGKVPMDAQVGMLELLPKIADPILDGSIMNQQVEQFHYLGTKKYRFYNFYHPYVNDFIKTLNLDGVEGLLTREVQQQIVEYFQNTYLPTENVHTLYPIREVDFTHGGTMSIYNWELFFHVPMLVADRLSKNQRFEEAQQWYHFIFNPLDRSSEASPNKFWQFRPFFELYGEGEGGAEDSIYNLLYALSYNGTDSELLDKKAEVEQQVEAWLDSPFDPHAIAALRPVAYMKAMVMKYIDNLIDWGDHLFRQDTIESINEATQIYILAAQILGKRPELIPVEETEARTYNELVDEAGELDAFSNALVTLENVYTSVTLNGGSSAEAELLPKSLYFCIPNNPDLLAYWDTVEDRLFKIRHCMNIEGVVRQLPLFQPPIDPALLVKARAAGLSIGSVLNDLYAPLPHYRYRMMVQKAIEFCSDVKALGNTLLTVLEKRDVEEMALLRAGHELKLLQVMKDVKKLQLDEARENLSALKEMKKITETRYEYYTKIEKINNKEQLNLDKLDASRAEQKLAERNEKRASNMHNIPNVNGSVTFGAPPKFSVGATFGGANLGAIANAYASGHRNTSSQFAYEANKASILAGYNRRWDEWKLQEKLASRELVHVDKQITAAEIRVAILEKEVDNHEMQMEHNREVNELMTSKFTNKTLYDWMTGQLSTVYFQSYKMAYDLAKKAQKALQYELGSDQSFIEFGYWDSLKKGLLAGDKLHYDIRRMEVAYLDQSKRTYELNRSVSLAMLDPLALVQLRETGTCYINLPEALFDLDHAGHYMRRIKSVQLTLPCVTGPYTSVSCKLTLLDNKWRKDSSGDYLESIDDSRFVYNTGGTQSIATSSGQNDSGMFQLNFNDERYLPFEGAGAISNWRLELPAEMRAFDYNTLSDVIMQISYTAKDGGEVLKGKANDALQGALMAMALGSGNAGLSRMFSLKHEFANDWYRFLNPPDAQEGQHIALPLDSSRYPHLFQKFDIVTSRAEIILVLEDDYPGELITLNITPPDGSIAAIELSEDNSLGGQLSGLLESISAGTGDWLISVDEAAIPAALKVTEGDHIRLNADVVKNMILMLSYGIE